jgi:4-hydroxybenzoyl-CoA reductase alpha subunit
MKNNSKTSLDQNGHPHTVVGTRHRRVDAMQRLTGESQYTDDIILPRMLHGKILRSPHAHANIIAIDTSAAEKLDGVAAVITGKDLPIPYGIIPWTQDEHALALERVRYVGDAVAAVAARDEETALAALRLIKVEYEVLPTYFTPEEALGENVVKIHPHTKHKDNTSKHVHLEFGPVDEKLAEADMVIEGDYYFQGTTHTAIEPHCAIGHWDINGRLTVWSATQVPHYLHRELARVLEMPQSNIRVIQPDVGGAFGGKSEPFDLEFCVAKLSQIAKRPVKILYTREEVFYAHRGRHPMKMHYKTAFDKQGNILAVDAKTLIDGGAYSSFGLVTTYYSGQLLTSPYIFQSFRFDSTRAFTNKPACGPKRGHGSVQPRFAIEVQLDKAAHALGIDPIELRRKNAMPPNSKTINEMQIRSNGFLECLDNVEKASGWKERYGKLPFGYGLGVACSTYISGTNYPIYPNDMPQSAVKISLDRSGHATVYSGASEIGQGSNTMLAVVAAQELGLGIPDVRVISADTDLTPVDLGAYSSRITLMTGTACYEAATRLAKMIRKSVAKRWECQAKDVVLGDHRAIHLSRDDLRVPIAQAYIWAEEDHGALVASGAFNTITQGVHGDYRGGTIGASPAYSFTAHVAEVAVDVETGIVKVEKIWAAHDCGKALSPISVEGQIEGSVYMGAAEALMEHHEVKPDHAGLLDAPSLLDYRIPTALDTPEIESIIVESNEPMGPYGAKEAGEGPLHPAIPAIANAIYDAVGVRIDTLPITPAKVLAALRERENGK